MASLHMTKAISITLPDDMAEMVQAKVASGEYATESEVIHDGLRALQAREADVEKWLRDEVVKAYDEHQSGPGKAIPAEEIMPRLRSAHRAHAAKRGS
jgi:putative addiction module CopG family antidote